MNLKCNMKKKLMLIINCKPKSNMLIINYKPKSKFLILHNVNACSSEKILRNNYMLA